MGGVVGAGLALMTIRKKIIKEKKSLRRSIWAGVLAYAWSMPLAFFSSYLFLSMLRAAEVTSSHIFFAAQATQIITFVGVLLGGMAAFAVPMSIYLFMVEAKDRNLLFDIGAVLIALAIGAKGLVAGAVLGGLLAGWIF